MNNKEQQLGPIIYVKTRTPELEQLDPWAYNYFFGIDGVYTEVKCGETFGDSVERGTNTNLPHRFKDIYTIQIDKKCKKCIDKKYMNMIVTIGREVNGNTAVYGTWERNKEQNIPALGESKPGTEWIHYSSVQDNNDAILLANYMMRPNEFKCERVDELLNNNAVFNSFISLKTHYNTPFVETVKLSNDSIERSYDKVISNIITWMTTEKKNGYNELYSRELLKYFVKDKVDFNKIKNVCFTIYSHDDYDNIKMLFKDSGLNIVIVFNNYKLLNEIDEESWCSVVELTKEFLESNREKFDLLVHHELNIARSHNICCFDMFEQLVNEDGQAVLFMTGSMFNNKEIQVKNCSVRESIYNYLDSHMTRMEMFNSCRYSSRQPSILSCIYVTKKENNEMIEFCNCGYERLVGCTEECNLYNDSNKIANSILTKCLSKMSVQQYIDSMRTVEDYDSEVTCCPQVSYVVQSPYTYDNDDYYVHYPGIHNCFTRGLLHETVDIEKSTQYETIKFMSDEECDRYIKNVKNSKLYAVIGILTTRDKKSRVSKYAPMFSFEVMNGNDYDYVGLSYEEMMWCDNLIEQFSRHNEWYENFAEGGKQADEVLKSLNKPLF